MLAVECRAVGALTSSHTAHLNTTFSSVAQRCPSSAQGTILCFLNMQHHSVGIAVTTTSGSTSWRVCRCNSTSAIELLLSTRHSKAALSQFAEHFFLLSSRFPSKFQFLKASMSFSYLNKKFNLRFLANFCGHGAWFSLIIFSQVKLLLLNNGGPTSSRIWFSGTKKKQSRSLLRDYPLVSVPCWDLLHSPPPPHPPPPPLCLGGFPVSSLGDAEMVQVAGGALRSDLDADGEQRSLWLRTGVSKLEGGGRGGVVWGGAASLSSLNTAVHQPALSRASARHTIGVTLHDSESSCGYFW